MSESRNELKKEFQDQEYREAYADDFLNTSIATQLVVLREQRGFSQEKLAQEIGTYQAGISRIENVNYSAWNIRTLKKIAFALGCRLKVSIETFGSLLDEAENFSRKALERPSFEDDPVFSEQSALEEAKLSKEFSEKTRNEPTLPYSFARPSLNLRAVVQPDIQGQSFLMKPLEVTQQRQGQIPLSPPHQHQQTTL